MLPVCAQSPYHSARAHNGATAFFHSHGLARWHVRRPGLESPAHSAFRGQAHNEERRWEVWPTLQTPQEPNYSLQQRGMNSWQLQTLRISEAALSPSGLGRSNRTGSLLNLRKGPLFWKPISPSHLRAEWLLVSSEPLYPFHRQGDRGLQTPQGRLSWQGRQTILGIWPRSSLSFLPNQSGSFLYIHISVVFKAGHTDRRDPSLGVLVCEMDLQVVETIP